METIPDLVPVVYNLDLLDGSSHAASPNEVTPRAANVSREEMEAAKILAGELSLGETKTTSNNNATNNKNEQTNVQAAVQHESRSSQDGDVIGADQSGMTNTEKDDLIRSQAEQLNALMSKLSSLESMMTGLKQSSLLPSEDPPLEQSTMQRRSVEDSLIQRPPNHQVPNEMSAVDSSDSHPREGEEGQGDGADNAGSGHNPD